ncbi:acyl-CoA synthetase [Mycolicibacterium duvalii]|uniref:Acyl-CoA synthetase n=1 Tax=Mycolicibacterium duvalii TaxID=39688 RepID=A0A7I7K0U0_9MYCO|nr:acyl-CoA synthetase [Mycolicibacterium duvalii]
MSIPRMVWTNAQRFGAAEAVVDLDAGVRLSFEQLGEQLVRSVKAAVALGIAPGDRVVLWAPNSADWIIAALGVLGAGAILVPLNTRFKGAEAAYVITKSGASAVLTVPEFLGNNYPDMLDQALPASDPVRRRVVLIGPGRAAGATAWADYLGAGDTVPTDEALARIHAVGPDSVSDIMFTSGTTGAPKGVVLTHGQTLRMYANLAEVFTFRPGDRQLIIPPFFHSLGYKAGWLASLMMGATAIPQSHFDVDTVLKRLSEERISVLLGPPTVYTEIIRHPRREEHDLSHLRVAAPTATKVAPELMQQVRDVLGFDMVFSAYGLTEASAVVSTTHADDDLATATHTVGQPMRDVDVRLVDDVGNQVPTGNPGEVLVRGYNVMRGYWDDPEETAKAIDDDGWLRTGDVGVLDEEGFLSIVDRKKDMFIIGGFNAYPAEIERALRRHDKVIDVAVIGVPDERLGEVGVAYVVAEPAVNGDELLDWVKGRLANFKVPRHVFLVDDLPRNASMKVLKNVLRERYDGQRSYT